MPPAVRDIGVVPDFAHLAVRYVLDGVVSRARLRDLDHAGVTRAAEKRAAAGVAGVDAVDVDHVIVQPGHEGRRGDGPEPVGLLFHGGLGAAPEIELYLGGLGRLDPHPHATGVVDLRVLGSPDVGFGRMEAIRSLPECGGRPQHECPARVFHWLLLGRGCILTTPKSYVVRTTLKAGCHSETALLASAACSSEWPFGSALGMSARPSGPTS